MLRYEPYTKDRLSIFGDKAKYAGLMKESGCRWNSRMDIAGWNISATAEPRIKKMIASINKEEELRVAISNAKNRNDQKKYHRAKSPVAESPKSISAVKSPDNSDANSDVDDHDDHDDSDGDDVDDHSDVDDDSDGDDVDDHSDGDDVDDHSDGDDVDDHSDGD